MYNNTGTLNGKKRKCPCQAEQDDEDDGTPNSGNGIILIRFGELFGSRVHDLAENQTKGNGVTNEDDAHRGHKSYIERDALQPTPEIDMFHSHILKIDPPGTHKTSTLFTTKILENCFQNSHLFNYRKCEYENMTDTR